jgi:hypothetical protein
MYNFFAYHLSLDINKVSWTPTVNEDFVTILTPEQLHVFNDENPVPADALKGDKAVMDKIAEMMTQRPANVMHAGLR